MIPGYLDRLLADAPAVETGYGPARLECRTIGELYLPSGRIVACDAIVEPDLPPFALAAPPGTHPVRLAIVHLPGPDERIAAAWLRFAEGRPVRWTHATLEGMPDHAEPAYGVDSGTGAFLSAEAAPLLAERMHEGFFDELTAAMRRHYVHTRDWAVLPVPGAEPLNVAVFSSGFGDGAYASYWGHDADGRPVCLLTDFGLLDDPAAAEDDGDAAARRTAKPWWKFW